MKKTAAEKQHEREEYRQWYKTFKEQEYKRTQTLPKYEIEYIGGPYAGRYICHGINEHSEGQYIECQGPWDDRGNAIFPPSVYRYKNGAFHWVDPSKKLSPTEKCPLCGGRGYVKDESNSQMVSTDGFESPDNSGSRLDSRGEK